MMLRFHSVLSSRPPHFAVPHHSSTLLYLSTSTATPYAGKNPLLRPSQPSQTPPKVRDAKKAPSRVNPGSTPAIATGSPPPPLQQPNRSSDTKINTKKQHGTATPSSTLSYCLYNSHSTMTCASESILLYPEANVGIRAPRD